MIENIYNGYNNLRILKYKFLLTIFFFIILSPSVESQEKAPQNYKTTKETNEVDTLRTRLEKEFYKKNYDKAIEYGEKGLKLADSIKYYRRYVSTASFLGSAYLSVEDTVMARITFTKSIERAKELGDAKSKIISQIDGANF
ncbi:MAG: tetratricopeptide (TPR) repeat protein [Dokdonia sp.]|jgi:tetratricopeptide (TPR) repeat protein